jgi:hypothetical protein
MLPTRSNSINGLFYFQLAAERLVARNPYNPSRSCAFLNDVQMFVALLTQLKAGI